MSRPVDASDLEKLILKIQRLAAGLHAQIANAGITLGGTGRRTFSGDLKDELDGIEILVISASEMAERVSCKIGAEVDEWNA